MNKIKFLKICFSHGIRAVSILLVLIQLSCTTNTATSKTEKLLIDTKVVSLPDDPHHRPGWEGSPEEYHFYWDLPTFNWCSPINFAEGTLETYFELIDQPSTKSWCAQIILDETKDGKNTLHYGHHWNTYFETNGPGVYTKSIKMTSLYDTTNLIPEGLANPKLLRLLLANQYGDHNGPFEHIPFSDGDYYPMKLRIIWVVVAKDSTFSGWDNYINK